jgi:hypothetical protein
MAEKADNRFTRMLQTARGAEPEEVAPVVADVSAPVEETKSKPHVVTARNGRGRPATGKRSDPDYDSTTVFLKRSTKKAAAKVLLDDEKQDLSDVLEKLLSAWVKRQIL